MVTSIYNANTRCIKRFRALFATGDAGKLFDSRHFMDAGNSNAGNMIMPLWRLLIHQLMWEDDKNLVKSTVLWSAEWLGITSLAAACVLLRRGKVMNWTIHSPVLLSVRNMNISKGTVLSTWATPSHLSSTSSWLYGKVLVRKLLLHDKVVTRMHVLHSPQTHSVDCSTRLT